MTDYEIDEGFLVIDSGRIAIPDHLMDGALTKSGVIDGRSKAGKALKSWIFERVEFDRHLSRVDNPPSASRVPEHRAKEMERWIHEQVESKQAKGGGATDEGMTDKPADPVVAVPKDMPRLGSHEASAKLVEIIANLYPDAKPSDWRAVQSMLQNAMRYGKQFGDMVRKPGP